MKSSLKNLLTKVLKLLGSLSYDSGWQASGISMYRKVGNVVTVVGVSYGNVTLTAGQYTTVAMLPVGFRPVVQMGFNPVSIGQTGVDMTGWVHNGGDVNIYSNTTTTYWGYSVSFLV